VHLRPSQTKINYPPSSTLHPALCILDLVRPAYLKYPARLSAETIVNLNENNVPKEIFAEL
jgi:hypothetical protein